MRLSSPADCRAADDRVRLQGGGRAPAAGHGEAAEGDERPMGRGEETHVCRGRSGHEGRCQRKELTNQLIVSIEMLTEYIHSGCTAMPP